jgi:hypothetical protein
MEESAARSSMLEPADVVNVVRLVRTQSAQERISKLRMRTINKPRARRAARRVESSRRICYIMELQLMSPDGQGDTGIP